MRRSVLFSVLLAMLVSASLQQQALESIGAKFRRAAPAGMGNLGAYVAGVQAFAFLEEASFSRSQIDQYLGVTKTFSLGLGSPRMLFWRRRRAVSRVVRRVNRVVAAPAEPYGGARISFKPWSGITALKFGTSYSHISLDSALHFPGPTWVKATGVVGIRQGDTIITKVAYGWAVGSGQQLFTHTKVRKCRRRLFSKKCWDEWIKINRGVNANELHSVSDGMNHLLFNKIADVSGPRLLFATFHRKFTRRQDRPLILSADQELPSRKVLSGVEKSDIEAALAALKAGSPQANHQTVYDQAADKYTLIVEDQ